MTARGQLADVSGMRVICSRCGETCPEGAASCPSCSTGLGGATVLDVETDTLGAHGGGATSSQNDTTPNGNAVVNAAANKALPAKEGTTSRTPPARSNAREFDEEARTTALSQDDQARQVTTQVARRPSLAESAPAHGSSSDPPTRFLRGLDQHIDLPNGSMVDDYEIDAKIGQGAMGVVYSARHTKLGRRVAIKVIAPSMGGDPQALARFEREARALASLQHPNIVDVTAFGTLPDERSYFVMEYLVGSPLDERLERGRVPFDEALDVLDQIARALEAAHAQGIVHRDLKPSNTFLARVPHEQRPIVKLLDFGLVKLAVADGVEQTASGAVIGTALYLSPEQCRGPNVDGRTDIYALGCIAYELVLSSHPFPEARTNTAAIGAHLTELPPPPRSIWPGIPAALDQLLFSMLAKNPGDRPTLAQVRHVIASVRSPILAAAGRSMRAATEVTTPSAHSSRGWIAALTLFVLVIGIAFGASVLGSKSSDRRDIPRSSPVAIGASSPNDARDASAALKPDVILASAVAAPEALRDASVDTAKRAKPKPPTVSPVAATTDAAIQGEQNPEDIEVISKGASVPTPAVAGATPDAVSSSPERESPEKLEVVERKRPAQPEVIKRQAATTPSTTVHPASRSSSSLPTARLPTSGTLSLDSNPPTEVRIDGEHVGRTPIVRKLSVGTHNVTLRNPTYGIAELYQVEIRPGLVSKIEKDLRDQIPEAKKTLNPFRNKGSSSP